MGANFQQEDPKAIWQEQQTETSTMSLILIRQKARQLRSRKRRQALGTVVAPIVVAFFYGVCIKQFPHIHPLLHAVFVLSLVWSVAGVYLLSRAISSEVMPGDAGFTTGLEFCRREMERQLSYLGGALLWSFGPIVLAMAMLVATLAARASVFPRGIPLITLALVWIAAYLVIRARQQRDLERELDELIKMERGSS
jgi:MFS family permease